MIESTVPTALQVGLSASCPRCGQGRLYDGLLKPADHCSECFLDYGFIDSGDGPAVFVILVVGFLVTALAMAVQANFELPLWAHLFVWVPIVFALSAWGLRFAKGVMISLQYQTKAEEGVLREESE